MSASGSAVSPSSWRGVEQGHGHLNHSAYDPAQSFAYTSACSGPRAASITTGDTPCGGPPDGVLTCELIEEGLTDLRRTGDGTAMTYLNLSLSGYGLQDISILSSYRHIQRLNLASNNLTDLSSLGNLAHLVYLDVSYNKLTSILDFQPPPKNLQEVNYSHNEIEEICDLSCHLSLSKLILDFNQITEISGLSSLHRLTHLSLADNRIELISNLHHLSIKFLRLSGNALKVITNLETLYHLQVIDLSGNNISSLKGLEGHPYLSEIIMDDNKVMDVREVLHLKDLLMLRTLNLSNNPIETMMDYRSLMVFHLPNLTMLDSRRVDPKEKVTASNRFAPPMEVVAAQDHRVNITGSVHKPARLRFSTLTRLDEPYPMLVLCGPPCSGKGYFCKLLVEEFPGFFGLGVSHTTRPQRQKESHGRDYYFIDNSTFSKAVKSGEFVQTSLVNGQRYGLTMAAIEQVAQQGLACVTHMSIEGVLTMKKTHFEPRYVLTLPLTPQVHEQRLRAKGCYSEEEIQNAISDIHKYKQFHLERPGFFDTAINTDSHREGYPQLRALVMAYGDIAPDSPLSLSSSSQDSLSSLSTSEQSSPTHRTQASSVTDPFEMDTGTTPSNKHESLLQIQKVAKLWSHSVPSTHGSCSTSVSRPISGRRQDVITPSSDQSGRQHKLIKAALAGKVTPAYTNSTCSASRPGTSMSKSETHTRTTLGTGATHSLAESSNDDESSDHSLDSSFSRLSFERNSPHEQLASPISIH